MADLDFLAAGVTEEDEQWTRKTERQPKANPFEPKLQASWDARTVVGTGANAKTRGRVGTVQVTTWEQLSLVRNALIRAGRALDLGVGLAYFGPAVQRGTYGPEDEAVLQGDAEEGEPIMLRPMIEASKLKTEKGWNENSGGDVLLKFRAQPKRTVVEAQDSDSAA